jgi:hypothetical protein
MQKFCVDILIWRILIKRNLLFNFEDLIKKLKVKFYTNLDNIYIISIIFY